MVEQPGRRERKKQQTRQALIDAAIRLFEERGYERTTVLDIAEAADVSDRTFFLHFRTKEEVILGSTEAREEAALRAVAERKPDDSPADVLERAAVAMIDDTWRADLPDGLAALRIRLLGSTPPVQARLLQRLLVVQTRLAEALHEAWPDRISELDAAALVGSVLGALNAATITAVGQQKKPKQIRAAMLRAVQIALHRAGPLADGPNL